nr:glucose-1-phosphate cytidylyltransferase [Dactylosporangium thailandense]
MTPTDLHSLSVVVLAGGRGTRLGSLSEDIPKPLVEIGGRPILWHILRLYEAAGIQNSIIAAGYLANRIGRNFDRSPTVQVVDTGLSTSTAGRVRRLAGILPETFCLTYGDGLSDVRIADVVEFHHRHARVATVTAVQPPARFGALSFTGDQVTAFAEKSHVTEGWINGGFMVFERAVLDWINDDSSSLEQDVLPKLAGDGQLVGFRHEGFWQCMDTADDVRYLNGLWAEGRPPWRTW